MKIIYNLASVRVPPNTILKPITQALIRKFKKEFKFDPDYSKDTYSDEIDSSILLTPGGRDWVGYVCYHTWTREILLLEVNARYRRQGYGKYLLNKVYKEATHLWVKEENNDATLFYRRVGWELSTEVLWTSPTDLKSNKWKMFYKLNNVEDPLYVGDSKIHGKGLFVAIHLPVNSNSDTKRVRYAILLGPAFIRVKNTGDPDIDITRSRIGRYANHSDDPNMMLVQRGNEYYYQLIKEVLPDTELTVDYKNFPW